MRRLNKVAKYSPLNLKLTLIYKFKQEINNSKMPEDLKRQSMNWCDKEINKFWRWSKEERRGYSAVNPPGMRYAKTYRPTCPYGYEHCVSDPAYIKAYYPDWFEELYGNKTPWQAAREHCDPCLEKYPKCCPWFDDEDK